MVIYPHPPNLEELLAQGDVEEEMTQQASASPPSVSPFNIKNFEVFLVKSHCDENYEFWKACNYYLKHSDIPTFDFVQWNTRIYENFIQVNAPMECNLPQDIRKAYQNWYDHGVIPSREVVFEARQHALNLMSDAYRQFVRYTNNANPPPPSPSPTATVQPPTTSYFPQQRDLKKRKNSRERRPNDLKLQRSTSGSTNSKNNSRVSIVMDSASSSKSDLSDTLRAGASTKRLISKGKALVTKLKQKTKRPALNSAHSANSGLPY